jgi:hypothetical protein
MSFFNYFNVISNIFLNNGHIKLSDVSEVKSITDFHVCTCTQSSLGYMSPEMHKKRSDRTVFITNKTDVW